MAYHVGIRFKYDRFDSRTNLDHYWGPPNGFHAMKSVPVLDFVRFQNAKAQIPILFELVFDNVSLA